MVRPFAVLPPAAPAAPDAPSADPSDAELAAWALSEAEATPPEGWLSALGGLRGLSDLSPAAVERSTGLPAPAARRLWAAIELGKRAWSTPVVGEGPIETPDAMAALLAPPLRGLPMEQLHVAYLDTRLRLIERRCIAVGSDACVVVEPRDVLRHALALRSRQLVLAHNHPSGDPEPSHLDLSLTRRLVELCRAMGVDLLDHLVVGREGWVSMRAEGLLVPTGSAPARYVL